MCVCVLLVCNPELYFVHLRPASQRLPRLSSVPLCRGSCKDGLTADKLLLSAGGHAEDLERWSPKSIVWGSAQEGSLCLEDVPQKASRL